MEMGIISGRWEENIEHKKIQEVVKWYPTIPHMMRSEKVKYIAKGGQLSLTGGNKPREENGLR